MLKRKKDGSLIQTKKNANYSYTKIPLSPISLGKIQNLGNTLMARLWGNRPFHPRESKCVQPRRRAMTIPIKMTTARFL